ncbi:TonB-dependent receptor [Aestuariicella hydrocarbonica]|uniref:TonB-dependent receptor n=1 Tax=Pseudomaricurvus hydrocarbonicus TaxID=1470433 RepID=A0A9E5JY57_9GAMM|nr:TonB-dependent receptor [Aestuariicella hydrocarbonica]NHO66765.1 TonB-dependent receptor [Aestuariicella hydrocarbonica]
MQYKTQKTFISQAIALANKARLNWVGVVAITPAVLLGAIDVNAQSSTSQEESLVLEEIVVTARRRDESIQDVPLTVNVVTAEALDELNIRKFEDLSSVVAGLTLQEDSIAPNASVRGVRFDTFASGFNPTVEFYLNDAPIVSLSAMQALFDVGQIEVLRGPQGTLRGRASPSGSITITAQRPDLNEFGGYIDLTATDIDGQNARGAVNIPIIKDMLAIRFAGFYEKNDGADLESINSNDSSENQGDGWRGSLRFEPTDSISINAMYQKIVPERTTLLQMESANLENPALPASPTPLDSSDRKAVTDIAEFSRQELERAGLEFQWEFANQQFNYAGSWTDQKINRKQPDDTGNFFDSSYPDDLDTLGQEIETNTKGSSHEIRLSSTESLFGTMDYIVGAFYQENESITDLINQTPVFAFFANPATFATIADTDIVSDGESTEKSIFGNLTFQLGEATELSAGARYIEFENTSSVVVSGNTISDVDSDWDDTIYAISLKHNFSEDIMGYVSYGSSWRPGINTVGDFNVAPSARERSFLELEPETSDSIEFGIKSSWLDNRLRVNATAYYQEFDNYPYRAGGDGVYYVTTDGRTMAENVDQFNFVAAVPVEVQGVELETTYQITSHWNVNALLSWSEGKIDDGTIPCNDYDPADGTPDTGGSIPSIADIRTATGGDNLAACQTNYRANYAPLFTGTLQSEYSFAIGDVEAYVRGLVTMYGDSRNDPSNPLDDVGNYSTINFYTGLRDPEGKWEVMLYGKNIADTERVLLREATPTTIGYQSIVDFSTFATVGGTGVSSYRRISMTAPREFGLNVRYHF